MSDQIVPPSHLCVQLISYLLAHIEPDFVSQTWLEDQQIRFNLWAAQLGVFARGTQSVRHRLRKNAPIRQAIAQLIDALLCNLRPLAEYCKPSDSDRLVHVLERTAIGPEGDYSGHESVDDEEERTPDLDFEVDSEDDIETESPLDGSYGTNDPVSLWVLRIEEDIGDLLRLASLIRQHGASKSSRRGEDFEPPSSDDMSHSDRDESIMSTKYRPPLSDRFRAFIEVILERELGPVRFQDQRLNHLKNRLRASMIRRWRRTCYRHKRAEELKRRAREIYNQPEIENDQSESIDDSPTGNEPETGLLPELADGQSHEVPPPKPTVRSEFSIGPATTLSSNFGPPSVTRKGRKDAPSSKPSSRVGDAKISLPPLPKKWLNSSSYDCPYCDQFPVIKELNLSTWKRHLWEDITPFVCLYDNCQSTDQEFATLHAWSEHTSMAHTALSWSCSQCHGTQAKFDSEAAFEAHLLDEHGKDLRPFEITIIAEASRGEVKPESCLICGMQEGMTTTDAPSQHTADPVRRYGNIETCMATHLQELALCSLPWHFGVHANDDDEVNDSTIAEIGDNEVAQEVLGQQPAVAAEAFYRPMQPRESPSC